jgi:hypothetical protein
LIQEKGKWKYRNDYNLNLVTFDNFASYIQYQTEKMLRGEVTFSVKKNMWGKIYLPVTIPHDPDGSPIRPKYKKR